MKSKAIDFLKQELKRDYKLYRAECQRSGVEPSHADFVAGNIPSCVQNQLERQKMLRAVDPRIKALFIGGLHLKAMGAAASL